MTNSSEAKLIIGKSDGDLDIFYATRFSCGDPFVFIEINGKKIIIVDGLEFGRAKKQARVDEVLLSEKSSAQDLLVGSAADVLEKHGVKRVVVPDTFGYAAGKILESRGFDIVIKPAPFFHERTKKTAEEIAWIEETQRATERALQKAVDLLGSAVIRNGFLYDARGEKITSELVRAIIDVSLGEDGCETKNTIVAGGLQAVQPHEEGTGALAAGASIVIDVFPRSKHTGYFADMTRSVCVGEPAPELQRMYDVCLQSQELGIGMIRAGVKGVQIQAAIENLFEQEGFGRKKINGRPQGFIHGTGHSLGLEIHERPAIRNNDDILEEGNVVTVEPGLYFEGIGGVRIEDIVVVAKNGCRNLTNFPKEFVLKTA